MPEDRVAALSRLRRGIGWLYVGAGVLHLTLMALMLLYLPPALPIWNTLYFAFFLLLILGGMSYLTIGFARSGLFLYEALSDFLIGIACLIVVFVVVAATPAPLFWLPGAFLLGYGWFRRRTPVLK